jgi:4,5-DOPA dioxygenase extradiol
MERLPTLFVSHGSPQVALEKDEYTRSLSRIASSFARPDAIVVVSAHWETRVPLGGSSAPRPALLYDFTGFSHALYQLTYPCPGAPELAVAICALLGAAQIAARIEAQRGFDHGVWIPLRLLYPDADIPVVEVALPASSTPHAALALGRALAPLRERGVLLVGSGGLVHNLGELSWHDKSAPAAPWAREFEEWFLSRLSENDVASLVNYRALAPHGTRAAPTPEHLHPLFVTLGSGHPGERVVHLADGFQHGTLSMRCFALSE